MDGTLQLCGVPVGTRCACPQVALPVNVAVDSPWPQLHLRLPHGPVQHVALHPSFLTVALYYLLLTGEGRFVQRADHGHLTWVRRHTVPEELAA